MNSDLDCKEYREWLAKAGFEENDKVRIEELVVKIEQLAAENIRLRKALLRASSHSGSRMSTKLKDALYE
ncbi:hypothetical protein ACFQ3W_08145 [Paenibacillus puldeungensis]|uniref:Uncharacterized protein n=1 Tax=Paenibacillus puldeungensis TaxID=696536 RepID=A0ABW3RUV7_9BACL